MTASLRCLSWLAVLLEDVGKKYIQIKTRSYHQRSSSQGWNPVRNVCNQNMQKFSHQIRKCGESRIMMLWYVPGLLHLCRNTAGYNSQQFSVWKIKWSLQFRNIFFSFKTIFALAWGRDGFGRGNCWRSRKLESFLTGRLFYVVVSPRTLWCQSILKMGLGTTADLLLWDCRLSE